MFRQTPKTTAKKIKWLNYKCEMALEKRNKACDKARKRKMRVLGRSIRSQEKNMLTQGEKRKGALRAIV